MLKWGKLFPKSLEKKEEFLELMGWVLKNNRLEVLLCGHAVLEAG